MPNSFGLNNSTEHGTHFYFRIVSVTKSKKILAVHTVYLYVLNCPHFAFYFDIIPPINLARYNLWPIIYVQEKYPDGRDSI